MVNIQALILLVIFVLILTALAPTIITSTATTVGTSLENASSSSKSMFGLIEILYPVIGVLGIVTIFEIRRRV